MWECGEPLDVATEVLLNHVRTETVLSVFFRFRLYGADDGGRTRSNRFGKPGLYQLSYICVYSEKTMDHSFQWIDGTYFVHRPIYPLCSLLYAKFPKMIRG